MPCPKRWVFISRYIFLALFFFLYFLFFILFVERHNGPAPARPLQEGRFWKRSETKKSEWTKRSLPCWCKDVEQISALQKFCKNQRIWVEESNKQNNRREKREERGGRRIGSVARCGGELCRKNKSETKNPSLVIAGSWPADHSPNREWDQKMRKRKARGNDLVRASGMPAARVHG